MKRKTETASAPTTMSVTIETVDFTIRRVPRELITRFDRAVLVGRLHGRCSSKSDAIRRAIEQWTTAVEELASSKV